MSTTVYVGNLYRRTDEDRLREAFSPYGEVLKVSILRDEYGNSRRMGFVTFATSDQANAAIKGLNETELDGNIIRVTLSKSRVVEGGGGKL